MDRRQFLARSAGAVVAATLPMPSASTQPVRMAPVIPIHMPDDHMMDALRYSMMVQEKAHAAFRLPPEYVVIDWAKSKEGYDG